MLKLRNKCKLQTSNFCLCFWKSDFCLCRLNINFYNTILIMKPTGSTLQNTDSSELHKRILPVLTSSGNNEPSLPDSPQDSPQDNDREESTLESSFQHQIRTRYNSEYDEYDEYDDSDEDNDNPLDEIAFTSSILGIIFGVSIVLFFLMKFKPLPIYLCSLSLFHFLEYWITAKYNPSRVNSKSFLINNGLEYTFAHLLSLIEVTIELYFIKPNSNLNFKFNKKLWIIGFLLMIIGQTFRSLAMIQCSDSFSHIIEVRKVKGHVLVTDGVYSISRHPSYFGFFWWALGTQILLLNPITFIAFSIVLYGFFKRRIICKWRNSFQFFLIYFKLTPFFF